MKIIITYASAGAGHFKAAEAIYDYLRENAPSIDAKLIDALEETNAIFRFLYRRGYSFLVRRAVFIWEWGFWLTDFRPLRFFTRPLATLVNRLNSSGFANLLIREKPDVIISTHFLPSEIAAGLKKSKRIQSILATIITDLAVHPFWISAGTDFYIVASGVTKAQLIKENVPPDSIKEFGIPIHTKFLKQFDKDSLCSKLGIDKDKFTVLVMTGSFGVGPLEEIADLLYQDVQVLVVCAANQKLYLRLKNKNLKNVKAFRFVDNTQEFMAVADMVITKPGGMTIAEILAMELVPVFISPILGQESSNADILASYGIGLKPENIEDIKNKVLDFKNNSLKLREIKDNIRKIKKPGALREICDALCQGSIRDSC